MAEQLSREAALARLAEIEDEIARLSSASDQQTRPSTIAEMRRREEQPGFNQTEAQKMGAAMQAEEQRLAESGYGSIFDEEAPFKLAPKSILRYGVPLAAGLATGPVGGLAALARTAAITGGAAGLGEAGAQTVERVAEDKEYRPGEIAGATIRSAAPMFKGLAPTMAAAGAAGAAAAPLEGRSPLKEAGIQAGAVGFLGSLGKAAGFVGDVFKGGAQRAAEIERIGPGVQATIGQAFPEFAGLESRVAAQTGSQELRKQLQDQSQAIARAVQGVMGVPAENYPNLVNRIAQTIGDLGPETGARLANEAQNVTSAFGAVEKARTEAQRSLAQDALAEAQQAFQKAVDV